MKLAEYQLRRKIERWIRLYKHELGLEIDIRLECREMNVKEEGWFHADWSTEYDEGILRVDLAWFLREIQQREREPDFAERTVRHELLHLHQLRVWDEAWELAEAVPEDKREKLWKDFERAMEGMTTAYDKMRIWRWADPERRRRYAGGKGSKAGAAGRNAVAAVGPADYDKSKSGGDSSELPPAARSGESAQPPTCE